jgi:hypothetical protein
LLKEDRRNLVLTSFPLNYLKIGGSGPRVIQVCRLVIKWQCFVGRRGHGGTLVPPKNKKDVRVKRVKKKKN